MTCTNDMSANQYLLIAASKLAEVFHESDLVVAAWQEAKHAFGLRGYEGTFPDSNRTLAPLCGARGLVAQGWLVKHPDRFYSVSEQGREKVQEMAAGDRKPLKLKRMPTETAALLDTLFCCPAYTRYRSGMNQGTPMHQIDEFMDLYDDGSVIEIARKNIAAQYTELPSGQIISVHDLSKLQDCAASLPRRKRQMAKV